MIIKLLQLNIYKGEFINKIVEFVKKEDVDILNFQEVTGGRLSFNNFDCFHQIKNDLNYDGKLVITIKAVNDHDSYCGNAIFFKKSFRLLHQDIIWLKKFKEIKDVLQRKYQHEPHCALSLFLKSQEKTIQIINTHLAWGPNPKDKKFKLKQGEKLYNYMKEVNIPFVFSGDFNVSPDSQIVSWINSVGRNLIIQNKITNTLNPRVHRAKKLFPKGWAVDYIFVKKSIKVRRFKVIDDIDFSDHLALFLEFEI